MNLRKRNLVIKLSLALSLLLFVASAIQFLVLYSLWRRAESERIQLINWELATNYAKELRPLLSTYEEGPRLQIALARLASLNPEVEIYVLDQTGRPVAWSFRDPASLREKVPIEILEQFLQRTSARKLPLLGPKLTQKDTQVPFSAERISFRNQPGYLYIVLEGLKGSTYRGAVLDYYLLYGGALTSFSISVVTSILGFLAFTRITRRLIQLTSTVETIAAGDYSARELMDGQDEVSSLSLAINKMAETIEAGIASLKKSDESRREMIANLSHDLRSPITALQAHLETMAEHRNELSEEELQGRFVRMGNTVRNLTELLNQLFELSKLEAEGETLAFEPFSLLDLVTEDICAELLPIATQHSVQLEIDVPDQMPLVLGDGKRIYRVIQNLVKNALQHTPCGGKVTIQLLKTDEHVLVSITDTGAGIPLDLQERIFDRFYTADQARTRGQTGSGLGLAIVKQILLLHKTEIQLTSEVGVGSCFSFRLPFAKL